MEQMLVGLGWRVTGFCEDEHMRTVAVTSRDDQGVRFIITAHKAARPLGRVLGAQELSMAEFAAADSHPAAKRLKSKANGVAWPMPCLGTHMKRPVLHGPCPKAR